MINSKAEREAYLLDRIITIGLYKYYSMQGEGTRWKIRGIVVI